MSADALQRGDGHAESAFPPDGGLRRELKLTDAAAFSIGLIGPVGGMALLGAGAAGLLGEGATWAFIFAIIGVSLVAYGFIKLSQHISHTGSVYALVGITLGPQSGFVAGWALFGAYATIGTGSTIEIALFFNQFLSKIHVVSSHNTEWYWTGLITLILVFGLSFTEIKVITRVLLTSELIGAALVTLLSLVILIRLITNHAPAGHHGSWHFLSLPSGTGVGTIAGAAVFGFLAFAGFEGAAALGEETMEPKKMIPRALKIALVVVGIFFLLTIISQTLGYGTSTKSVAEFVDNSSPYGDLGGLYVGDWLGTLLDLVASLSLFAITLGTINGAARVLYALSRDATGDNNPLTKLSKRGAPTIPLAIISIAVLCFMTGQRLAGTAVVDATFYWLTIGTIALLVAYALATIGAFKFLFIGERKAPAWQAIIPVLALAFVVYTIYKNVVGVDSPYNVFPYFVAGWLIVGIVIVLVVPGLAGRVRERLASSTDADV